MYKKINTDKDKIGLYLTSKYLCYTLKSEEYRLYVCSIEDESEIIFISEEKKVNYYSIYGDNLIYISRDEDSTFLVNLKSKNKNQIDEILYDLVDNYYKKNKNYHCDNNHVYIYDLLSGNIVKIIKKTIIGYPKLGTDDYIITNNNIYIYVYSKTDFTLLWQKDLSEQTQYTEWDGTEEKGKIREVYEYQDSVIVLTQMFILRIDLQTGDIIYSLQLPAGLMELSIVGDKAYGCYGYHYMEVDIEKGKLLNFVRIENAVYQGKEYNAIMDSPKFHEGYVFHGVRLEGGYYAISALDAQTGKRMWIDLLGTYMVEKIEFYENKMFVSDSGGSLYIYEKEDA